MKQKQKRFLSLLLTFVLVFGLFAAMPNTVSAASTATLNLGYVEFSGLSDGNTIRFENAIVTAPFGLLSPLTSLGECEAEWTLNATLIYDKSTGGYEGDYTINIVYDLSTIRDNLDISYIGKPSYPWLNLPVDVETTTVTSGTWNARCDITGKAVATHAVGNNFYISVNNTAVEPDVSIRGASISYYYCGYDSGSYGRYPYSQNKTIDVELFSDNVGLWMNRVERSWAQWTYVSDGAPGGYDDVSEYGPFRVYSWGALPAYYGLSGGTLTLNEMNYDVTFDADGGTPAPARQTVDAGQKVSAVAEPKKEGYTFLGWYNGETKWNFASDTVTGDITLKAKWNCDVTFDAGGGSPVPVKETIASGSKLAAPVNPVKSDAGDFQGWYNGDKKWDFAADTVSAHMTLKAKYQCTVKFDMDGGRYAGIIAIPPADQTLLSGDKVTDVGTVSKDGVAFMGWYDDAKKWDFDTDAVVKNMTLKAKWGYKVEFDADLGRPIPETQIVIDGEKATEPPEPSSPFRLTFQGWYTEEDRKWDFSTDVVTKDIMLYADWGYIVEFDVNATDAATVPRQVVRQDEMAVKPADPAREGYTLKYWYKDTDFHGEGIEWDFSTPITEDITLYAEWDEGWIVTFDVDGGSPTPPKQTVKDSEKIKTVTAPTKEKFGFVGWRIGISVNYTPGIWDFELDTVVEDITLTAQWKEGEYTVTFDSAGGSAVPNQIVRATDESGTAKIQKPDDPARSGLRFMGWFNGAAEWNFETGTITKDTTLTAKWEEGWVVTFDSDGGVPLFDPPKQVVKNGEKAIMPGDPRKSVDIQMNALGTHFEVFLLEFKGWYNESAEWDFATDAVTKDVTLKAKWSEIFTVKFDVGDGLPKSDDQQVVEGYRVRGMYVSTPVKPGYICTGWYNDADKWDFSSDVVEKNMTLKAKYEEIETVTLDTGDKETKVPVVSGTSVAPPPTPMSDDKLFDGWYDDDGNLWDFENAVTNSITLTAKWSEIPAGSKYKVIFDAAGGMAAYAQQAAPDGGKLSAIPDPKRDGYKFLGWFLGEKLWDFSTDTLSGDYSASASGGAGLFSALAASEPSLTEITLVAKWEKLAGWYTAAFETEYGEAPPEQTVPADGLLSYAIPPERDGYIFLGWYNGTKLWDFDTDELKGDIKLTAVWVEAAEDDGSGGDDGGGDDGSGDSSGGDGSSSSGDGSSNNGGNNGDSGNTTLGQPGQPGTPSVNDTDNNTQDGNTGTDPGNAQHSDGLPQPTDEAHKIIPDPERSNIYIELDDENIPLGEWYQDEKGEWVFNAYVPLANLPQTGYPGMSGTTLWLLLFGILATGLGIILLERKRKLYLLNLVKRKEQ